MIEKNKSLMFRLLKLAYRVLKIPWYILAYSIVTTQSVISYIKSFGKKPIVHFEKSYSGEKVLLLALYEKGKLRYDILNLLGAAKEAGIYIIAVNTLKVINPDDLKNTIDCYIERPNFGRDFGSYKTGFLHVFKKKWEQECPRLLMLNDSLFYSKKNLPSFLDKMMNTNAEVLGSTENYDYGHHLGSFAIAYSGYILKHPKFKKYWEQYRNSNIRPKVIKNGEVKLSRTLKKCVSSPDQMYAYFNLRWISAQINADRKILNKLPEISRESAYPWINVSLKSVAEKVQDKYLYNDNKRIFFADNINDLAKEIGSELDKSSQKILEDRIYQEAVNSVLEYFVLGSQIHQNAVLLHYLGVPLVKLDSLYRGVLSIADIEKISHQMSKEEMIYFKNLIYSKQFGSNVLVGWKRAAFNLGFI